MRMCLWLDSPPEWQSQICELLLRAASLNTRRKEPIIFASFWPDQSGRVRGLLLSWVGHSGA